MASIAENLRATLLSLKQISDRVKSLILTSVTKSELNSAKQDVLDAIDEIDIDTSDLAKEATLGDVQDVLEYIEQGGMPEISAIAKQGTNPNATNTAILEAIQQGGSPADALETEVEAGKAAIVDAIEDKAAYEAEWAKDHYEPTEESEEV